MSEFDFPVEHYASKPPRVAGFLEAWIFLGLLPLLFLSLTSIVLGLSWAIFIFRINRKKITLGGYLLALRCRLAGRYRRVRTPWNRNLI